MIHGLSPHLLLELLRERLAEPLPGRGAQRLAAPPLSYGRHHGPPRHAARRAAVLALLYPRPEGWHVPLILRTRQTTHHQGQVSFPGGKLEPGETTCQAACRELQEELGVWLHPDQLAGELTPLYVFASNFHVTPWVAVVDGPPRFRTCPDEVDRLLELRLDGLPPPARWTAGPIQRRQVVGRVPQVAIGDHILWGASAMILAELLTLLMLLSSEGTADGRRGG